MTVSEEAYVALHRSRPSGLDSLLVSEPSRQWVTSYVRKLWWSDLVVVLMAVVTAQMIRFGPVSTSEPNGNTGLPAVVTSVAVILAWMVALGAMRTRDRRILGSGAEEYSRVLTASVGVFGLLAIISLLFKVEIARGFIGMALPLGTVALLGVRRFWRARLTARRASGLHCERVVVVGDQRSAETLIGRLGVTPELGFTVVGVCLPAGAEDALPEALSVGGVEVPVLGDFSTAMVGVTATGASTVAVTSAAALGHGAMQELSWDLHEMDVDMIVAPGLTDVAGPRMLMRPVAGLPLLHVDKPRFEGATKLRKACLDRIGAALILLLLLPVFIVVAVAIKVDSRGPVFYRGTRVGMGNHQFPMWKFRSMCVDADRMKADLTEHNEGDGLMFKMSNDPRVTRVGAIIRRYSIDELPQLFNVLGGTMSLVGPRPPLPEEVARYDGRVARRMLVKPGMTGLWQVSGRSDLPWEEAVRLDLSYVENWSIMTDLVILWRTMRAVVGKDGAY